MSVAAPTERAAVRSGATRVAPPRTVTSRVMTSRPRVHQGGAGALVARKMVKSTEGVVVAPSRPQLTVVAPRRRHAARWVALAAVFMFSTMLAAAAFQTQLAPRQLQLDQLDRDIAGARDRYDDLRRERAELRSPGRLEQAARTMGMYPVSDNNFMSVDPAVVAAVQESTGGVFADDAAATASEFDEFQAVKSVVGSAP